MSSLLMSRSMIRVISGFKHFLAPRREGTRISNLQAPIVNLSIVRSAQQAVEHGSAMTHEIDRHIQRMDFEIRRTGRITRKDVEDVFGKVKYSKSASSIQSLLILRCLGSLLMEELPQTRNELVQEIWDTLIKLKISMDISHYNTLLQVYIENNHQFSPVEFLSMLAKAGVEPNRVTYQRLLKRYCSEGDIEGASKILEFMKEKELPINENIFNALIMGHSKANDMESARGVLSVMKTAGLSPSATSYMNLMVGYAEKGDVDQISNVVAECKEKEVELQNKEYVEVILALASNGHAQHVSKFIQELATVSGYQQEAMNLILRLINCGCDEVAYQIFETMQVPQNMEGESFPLGSFFIRQLVRSELYSVATIVKYCQMMKREGLNIYALERALFAALKQEQPELALALLRVMVEDGASVRPHYFWPLFIQYEKRGEKENVYKAVKDMVAMEVPLTKETRSEYLIPSLLRDGESEGTVIKALNDCGVSLPAIINGFVGHYLQTNNLVSAAQLVGRYGVMVNQSFCRALAECYAKTMDTMAAGTVLRQMVFVKKDDTSEVLDKEGQEESEDTLSGQNESQDIAAQFLLGVVHYGRSNRVQLLESILQVMKSLGIGINKDSAVTLQSRLGEQLTESIANLLNDLSDGEVSLQPLPRENEDSSISHLEQRLIEREIRNAPHDFLLGKLLTIYARINNVPKAEEIVQKMESQQIPLTNGQQVLLLEMYAQDGQLEKALDIYKRLKSVEPEIMIRTTKLLKVAGVMVSNGLVEEAIKLLEENGRPALLEGALDNSDFACSRFLNSAIEQGKVSPQEVKRLFTVLLEGNYTKPFSNLCGALVKAFLANDDLNGAMEAFERSCKDYRIAANKHNLSIACINAEDTGKLQIIIDLSTTIHGEMNSLYDLVFAFLECGKVRQAKKILETPGLRARHQKLEQRCQKLLEMERTKELEDLISITKDVFDIDRSILYSFLLKSYKREGNCDKALEVWTMMQEENLVPDDSFLLELGQFLQHHNREIPFTMPKPLPPSKESETASSNPPTPPKAGWSTSTPLAASPPLSAAKAFNVALRMKDFEAAKEARLKLLTSGVEINPKQESHLIKGLIERSKLAEATQIAREMITEGKYPERAVFRYFLDNVVDAGDVDTCELIGQKLNEDMRKQFSYNSKLCIVYMKAARAQEYLDRLLEEAEKPDVNVEEVASKFPFGGIQRILDENPKFLPKVNEVMEKYASLGIFTPANCVWCYHFKEEAHDEANQVYEKYLTKFEKPLMFMPILKEAKMTSNENVLPSLLKVLQSRPNVPGGTKGKVYSYWLDILSAKGKYDEALGVLEGSLKEVELIDYNKTALRTLKEGLMSENKTFPYDIPEMSRKREQSKSSSSSSSSSDSDRLA